MDRRHKSDVFLRYEKELKKTKFYFDVSIKVATLTSTTESTTTASQKCITQFERSERAQASVVTRRIQQQ